MITIILILFLVDKKVLFEYDFNETHSKSIYSIEWLCSDFFCFLFLQFKLIDNLFVAKGVDSVE